jgi:hypothetical protein
MAKLVCCIFIEYRGHHRKGVAIYNANEINLQPKPWFHLANDVFLNPQRGSNEKKSINLHENIFLMSFSELLL